MKIATKQILNSPTLYISLLGPLFAVAILAILLIKAPVVSLLYPFLVLIGLPLCWIGHTRGLSIALTLLTLLGIYLALTLEQDRFWNLILLSSVGLTFAITTFSSLELDDLLFSKEEPETVVPPEQLTLIAQLQKELFVLRQDSENTISNLQNALADQKKTVQVQLQELTLVQNESQAAMAQKELALTTLNQNNQTEICNLKNMLLERDALLKDRLRVIETVRAELDRKEAQYAQELERLNQQSPAIPPSQPLENDSHKVVEELSIAISALQQSKQEKETLQTRYQTISEEMNAQLAALMHERSALETTISNLQQENQIIAQDRDNIASELHALTTERNQATANLTDIERAWRSSEGRYQQLKQQFADKSLTLDDTRRQLFQAEEEILRLNNSQQEYARERTQDELLLEKHLNNLEHSFASLQQQYDTEVDSLHGIIAILNKAKT